MSKSNIFNIIAILVIFGLLFFIFRGDEVDTSEYDAKIESLEKKVDSLNQKNTFLEKEADSLEFDIEQSVFKKSNRFWSFFILFFIK